MKNVFLSGDKLNYVEEGEGRAIVLLYGLFGSVKNFDALIRHLKKISGSSFPYCRYMIVAFQ